MTAVATPPVRYLVLWLTTGCNLRCAYCYRGDQPGRRMSLDVAKAALGLAAASGLPFHVQLAGGEPTLEPELMEAVGRMIREAGWPATLAVQTNGTLMDRHLVHLCQHSGMSVGVSLDGPPDVHERIRGSAAATYRGLALLDRAQIPVRVTTVLSALNVMHLDRLVLSLACFANVQGVALDPVVLKGNALGPSKNPALSPVEATHRQPCLRDDSSETAPQCLKEGLADRFPMLPSKVSLQTGVNAMLAVLSEVNRLRGHLIRSRELDAVSQALNGNGNKHGGYCHACHGESLAVHPDGLVYPCGQTVGDPSMAVGTVDCVDWDRLRSTFRETRLRGDCLGCRLKDCCPGDCPSRIHYNVACDPYHAMCLIYRTIIESLERKTHS